MAENVPIALRLARRWTSLSFDSLPSEAVEVSRQCLLDWFGCAIAGSAEPLGGILQKELVDGAAEGRAAIVRPGVVTRRATDVAALVNGAAGHALDFDDTHTLMSGHPSVPVVPAALALAEVTGATGAELVSAVVAGIEVECRIGALLNPGHYAAGWHATATLGTIGAAAACARLLQLDADRAAHALALAATQAGGVKASFGTMAKPLHAGKAAADGLLAARLAAAGFEGNPSVIEAPQGYAQAAGGATPDTARLERLESRWCIRDTLFKYHAACYLTHASIIAALDLRSQVDLDGVERIEVRVAPGSLGVCNIAEPSTGLEAKFSLRATTAMALLGDDTTDLAAYSDERARAPEIAALRDKVVVIPEDDRSPTRSKVTIISRSGEPIEAENDTGTPAADLDLQRERLSAKFRGLVAPTLGDACAAELRDALLSIDKAASVRDVTELLAG